MNSNVEKVIVFKNDAVGDLVQSLNAINNIIDLHKSFVNEKGEMDKNFAKDGLHLNEKGYANWCTQIENFVKN